MTSTAEQVRSYRGPAILSFGFRPFFLAGGVWAAVVVALWLPLLSGHLELPSAFAPVEWHVHELLYGYVPAIVAGFLLTAVPNWTGRLPVVGNLLLYLFVVWVVGRLAILFSAWLGPVPAAILDLAFLAALAAVIAREIIAAKNLRNLKILIVIGLLFAGNAVFHWEAVNGTGGGYGARGGIAAVILLIMVIGGRVIPSFTRNWLVKQGEGRLPAAFSKIDIAVIAVSALALAVWVAVPGHTATAVLAVIAGGANVLRLARWAGERTFSERLVLILHVAFAFVPLGFFALAFSIWRPELLAPQDALHAWTMGAIGQMTLAIMTRASLGHVGRPLHASLRIQFIYAAAFVAVCARLSAGFDISRDAMLALSAGAWVAAFAGFIVVFGPLLARSRA